jgi:hypothetical protein
MTSALRSLAQVMQHSGMRHASLLLAVVLLFPSAARAQRSDGAPSLRLTPAFGIHYGTPLRFSVAAGAMLDVGNRGSEGAIALVEQGQHGTELSAGYIHMLGQFGTGVSLRGAVLRTGTEPWNADPHTTYVGAEAQLMVIFGVGGRVGFLRRASKASTGPNDSIVSLSVSIGA